MGPHYPIKNVNYEVNPSRFFRTLECKKKNSQPNYEESLRFNFFELFLNLSDPFVELVPEVIYSLDQGSRSFLTSSLKIPSKRACLPLPSKSLWRWYLKNFTCVKLFEGKYEEGVSYRTWPSIWVLFCDWLSLFFKLTLQLHCIQVLVHAEFLVSHFHFACIFICEIFKLHPSAEFDGSHYVSWFFLLFNGLKWASHHHYQNELPNP